MSSDEKTQDIQSDSEVRRQYDLKIVQDLLQTMWDRIEELDGCKSKSDQIELASLRFRQHALELKEQSLLRPGRLRSHEGI